MDISREMLEETYRSVSDTELIERYQAGALTAIAVDVIEKEIERRGLSIPEPDDDEPEEPGIVESEVDVSDFETVETYKVPTNAYMAVHHLEQEGIQAFAVDDQMALNGVVPVRVQVAKSQLDLARTKLAEFNAHVSDLIEEEDMPQGPSCPGCGSRHTAKAARGFFQMLFGRSQTEMVCYDCHGRWHE